MSLHKTKKNPAKYQDYVIRNGQLIGDWEGLYQNYDDPWHQSRDDHKFGSTRMIALNWCSRLRKTHQVNRIVELGCGLGHLTKALHEDNFSCVGLDISKTAIDKARTLHTSSIYMESAFNDFQLLDKLDPDVYIMAEITWYVLDELDAFLKSLKERSAIRRRPIFLIHLLSTYAKGTQKYGLDKFTNLDEILAYFNLHFLEFGKINNPRDDDINSQSTYFIAKI